LIKKQNFKEDIIMPKNFKNSVKNITITVEDAVKKLKSNEYSVDFIAQRSDEQWSDEQKVNLLDSIFCGIVLPDMVIVQCEGKDEVIDGKQRLTTLKNYINNLFALPKNIINKYGDPADDDKKFDVLSDELKKIIQKTEIKITYYENCTREEAVLLFNRYNSGTPLSKAQKARGKFSDNTIKWTTEMTRKPIFKEPILKLTSKQKREEVQSEMLYQSIYLIDCYLGINGKERHDFKNLSSDTMNKYCEDTIEEFSDDERKSIAKTLDYVSEISGNGLRKSLIPFVILFGNYAIHNGISTEEFSEYVSRIESEVLKNEEYKEKCKQATISKKSVKDKMKYYKDLFTTKFKKFDLLDMELSEISAKDIDEKSKDSNKKTTKSKPVVDKEVTETTEVSTNSEATKDTAEVASTDVSSDNGVSSEATADASSDTSVATNEDSASDSSEADADPAKDVSDGTEVVA